MDWAANCLARMCHTQGAGAKGYTPVPIAHHDDHHDHHDDERSTTTTTTPHHNDHHSRGGQGPGPKKYLDSSSYLCDNPPMTNEQHTYWVSIGRNRGDKPASVSLWRSFIDGTVRIVEESGATILTDVTGVSSWEGVTEETYLVLITIDSVKVDGLRSWLAEWAGANKQDAIGFVGGSGADTLIVS